MCLNVKEFVEDNKETEMEDWEKEYEDFCEDEEEEDEE